MNEHSKSDLVRTKEFLDSIGVKFSKIETVLGAEIVFGKSIHGEKNDGYPECDKVDGYNGFHTCFNFDKNGEFFGVGVWE